MKSGITILVLFLSIAMANAQLIIKGKITDLHTNGLLPGATIIDEESGQGTTTDNNGLFSLTTGSPARLRISFIGYEPQLVNVTQTTFMNIRLASGNLQLSEVTVVGFDNNRKLIETAGAIAVLNQQEIQRSTNVSLAQSLNIIPGVRMEENGPGGTSRVSIRGSLLRSPWGIRNIKLYWNDIPLTDAAGTSARFNAIDVQSIGAMEVIKGPSGSIFGAGTGGVISITSAKAPYGQSVFELANTSGSYGLRRTSATLRTGSERSNTTATYVNQNLAGYRDHQRSDKETFTLTSEFNLSEHRSLSFNLFHYDGSFDLPGSLSAEEVKANRRQALAFNKDNDCRLSNKSTGLAVAQRYEFNSELENITSISTVFNSIDHPWGSNAYYNGYTIGNSLALTVRSRFMYSPVIGTIKTRFTAGIEWQSGNEIEKEYQNDGGETGDMQGDYELHARQSIFFGQGEFNLPRNIIVTIGASYNLTKYNFTNRLSADPELDIKFDPSFAPRIGVVKKLNDNVSAHGSVSYGFSPPTQYEVQTQAGINNALKAEHGTSYEAGIRGSILNQVMNFDVSAYSFQLKDAILPRYNEAQQEYFQNSGSTRQNGLETMISFLPIREAQGFKVVKPWISYTYNHYTFNDYTKETIINSKIVTLDYSGNRITGVPAHIVNAGLDLETLTGIYSTVTMNHVSEIPLTDTNDTFARSYTTLAIKAGYRQALLKHFRVDLFAGIENAFDASYHNFLALNAFDKRFYNPAPGRNYYGGLSLGYNLIHSK